MAELASFDSVLGEFHVITGFEFVKDEFPNETIKTNEDCTGYVQFFIESK